MTQSDSIGGWLLGRKLGAGGNATVWEATRRGVSPVALKVLNIVKTDREPYRRFVREVETMRSLTELEGVLPLIDAHLSSRPTRREPALLAMPIATPCPTRWLASRWKRSSEPWPPWRGRCPPSRGPTASPTAM